MPRFVLYSALSVDGYIADAQHGTSWLDPFNEVDYGYQSFIDEVDIILMGRTTYEQVLAMGDWMYAGKRCIIVSSALEDSDLPEQTEVWRQGIPGLVSYLKASEAGKTIWVMGGARLMRPFLDKQLISRMDLFVIPLLLGRGTPHFLPKEADVPMDSVRLEMTKAFPNGVVQLQYDCLPL